MECNRAFIDEIHNIIGEFDSYIHCHLFYDLHASIPNHIILVYFHRSCFKIDFISRKDKLWFFIMESLHSLSQIHINKIVIEVRNKVIIINQIAIYVFHKEDLKSSSLFYKSI